MLRGFANAGVKGDRSAMVISNKINATQLRIGQLIAIPPKDNDKKTTGVQIASIQNNKTFSPSIRLTNSTIRV